MLKFETMSDEYVLTVLATHIFKCMNDTQEMMENAENDDLIHSYQSLLEHEQKMLNEVKEKILEINN